MSTVSRECTSMRNVYDTPELKQLRLKRTRLCNRRTKYEKLYRQCDMLIHALDMTIQQEYEKRKQKT